MNTAFHPFRVVERFGCDGTNITFDKQQAYKNYLNLDTMKRLCLFTAALLLCTAAVHAQTAPTAAKSIFVEIGGPGVASFNYDTRFTKRNDGIGGRIGIGGFKIADVRAIFVPAGVNYLLGKDNRNFFELGAGVTFVSIKDRYVYDDNDVFDGTFGHLSFGYRLQPANGGFMFRAAVVPVFGHGVLLPYYAGVAFGYKF